MKPHKRRSQEQWQLLIKEQQSSGLNAAEFCRQKGLNDKYFSKRKRQLSTQHGKEFTLVKEVETKNSGVHRPSQC